jgi:plastocyanin
MSLVLALLCCRREEPSPKPPVQKRTVTNDRDARGDSGGPQRVPDPAPAAPVTPAGAKPAEPAAPAAETNAVPPAAPAAAPGATGDIAGVIKWQGPAPNRKTLDASADPFCAAARATNPILSERIVVNPNSTLKEVFIYVKKGLPEDQAWPLPTEPDGTPRAVLLDQVGCQYVPHVFGAMAGQPILIRNSDSTAHNIHAVPTNNSQFNRGQPQAGMQFTATFSVSEIMVPIKCDVHPWMSAFCGVLPHPFFAVSDTTGAFKITGLPPGNYVLETWIEHPDLKPIQRIVTVQAGEETKVDFIYAPPK